jgi:hypothetical protein
MILRYHAKERIRERFNVKPGEEQAFFDRHFPKSEKVCDVYNDRGVLTAHYVTGNIIFVIDESCDEVITLKDRVSKKVAPSKQAFKHRVREFVKSEIATIAETGRQLERQTAELDQAIREELDELAVQLKRTRSLAKKLAIKGRIMALDERFEEIPAEVREIRSNIRKEINGALAHY